MIAKVLFSLRAIGHEFLSTARTTMFTSIGDLVRVSACCLCCIVLLYEAWVVSPLVDSSWAYYSVVSLITFAI